MVKLIFERKTIFIYTLLLLIVTLHFQTTLKISNINLRFSFSDLVLPFALLISLLGLKFQSIPSVQWRAQWLPIWFLAFSCWLGVSLIQGYSNSGVLSKWGFVNKFLGWFVLIGYFYLGGIIGLLDKKIQTKFFNYFIMASWAISLCSVVIFVLQQFGFGILSYFCVDRESDRICGFLENPNAFGFMCMFSVLLQLPLLNNKTIFAPRMDYLGILINSLALLASGSRGALLASFFGGFILIMQRKVTFAKIINLVAIVYFIFMLCTSGILFRAIETIESVDNAIYSVTHQDEPLQGGKERKLTGDFGSTLLPKWIHLLFDRLKTKEAKIVFDHNLLFGKERLVGDGVTNDYRITITQLAFKWWQESPYIGIGLGNFLEREEQMGINPKLALHNSAIWLLTETGIIGLGLVLIFSFVCLRCVNATNRKSFENVFTLSGLSILIAFAIASLTTEIMYQRYLWFYLGLLLVSDQTKVNEKGNLTTEKLAYSGVG